MTKRSLKEAVKGLAGAYRDRGVSVSDIVAALTEKAREIEKRAAKIARLRAAQWEGVGMKAREAAK